MALERADLLRMLTRWNELGNAEDPDPRISEEFDAVDAGLRRHGVDPFDYDDTTLEGRERYASLRRGMLGI